VTAGAISPEKVAWAAHEHIGDELRFSAFQFSKAGAYVLHKYQLQGKVFHGYNGYVSLTDDGCLYTRVTECRTQYMGAGTRTFAKHPVLELPCWSMKKCART
jgi:hypothetical protein